MTTPTTQGEKRIEKFGKPHFKVMAVLVLCEESQEVCKAFRAKGHYAFSCDLQKCSGGKPKWHLKMDAFDALKYMKWDLVIAHPPCTYMSKAGARWMYPTAGNISLERLQKAIDAKVFFMKILNCGVKKICVENPQPLNVVALPSHTQVIQPYEYGHPFSKKTLLWLKGLPPLAPTKVIKEYKPYLPSNTGGAKRGQSFMYKSITQKESSKTFSGIAKAMADQWG